RDRRVVVDVSAHQSGSAGRAGDADDFRIESLLFEKAFLLRKRENHPMDNLLRNPNSDLINRGSRSARDQPHYRRSNDFFHRTSRARRKVSEPMELAKATKTSIVRLQYTGVTPLPIQDRRTNRFPE